MSNPTNATPSNAADMKSLQARELRLIVSPPAHLTVSEIDLELAELRWTLACRLAPDDIPGAISYASSSLQLQEARPDRWEQLGDLYTLSGELTSARDAVTAYDNALFLDPARRGARLKLASAYLMSGQIEQALRHLEINLCQTVDQEQQLPVLRVYVTACAVGNQMARGIAFCRARAAPPGDAVYQIGWAILEKARGNRDEAVKLLKEIENAEGIPSSISASAASLRLIYAGKEGGPK